VNITLSIEDELVERARAVAREQGTSLNALIREYVELLAGQLDGETILEQFEAMWATPGDSTGKRFDRDAIYDERTSRYRPR
jgi:hypothetical protein